MLMNYYPSINYYPRRVKMRKETEKRLWALVSFIDSYYSSDKSDFGWVILKWKWLVMTSRTCSIFFNLEPTLVIWFDNSSISLTFSFCKLRIFSTSSSGGSRYSAILPPRDSGGENFTRPSSCFCRFSKGISRVHISVHKVYVGINQSFELIQLYGFNHTSYKDTIYDFSK